MRSITATVGPGLLSSANDICLSQSPAGTSGNATCTFTGGNASIAATNAFVVGQAVTFSTVGTSGASPSNDAGTLPGGFNTSNTYYVIGTGLSTSHFEVSQLPGGGAVVPGTNTLTGTQYVNWKNTMGLSGSLVGTNGIATISTSVAQRVLITTADTTTTFTLFGSGPNNQAQSEALIAVGGTVQSAYDYYTITAITVNQAPTAAVTVGTNGVGSSPWVAFDEFADAQVSIQCNVVGTVNYTVQVSDYNPNSITAPIAPGAITWLNTNDTTVVGATASAQSNFQFCPKMARVLLNSGSGSVTTQFIQYGMVAY